MRTNNANLHMAASTSNGICRYLVMAAFIVYAVLSYFTPLQVDDLWYLAQYIGADSRTGYLSMCIDHWLMQNGRLGNMICPLFVGIFPPIVRAVLIAAAVVCLMVMSIELWQRSAKLVPVRFVMFWLLFVVCLPWHDNIFVDDFALNYVLSALLNVLFIRYLICDERVRWWRLPLALLAGWSHEGVSVPLLLAVSLVILLFRIRLSRRRIVLMIAYVCGILLVVASPGIWQRAGGAETQLGFRHFARVAVVWFPAVTGLLVAVSVCAIVPRWRSVVIRAMHNMMFVLAIVVALLTYAVVIYSGASFRAAFFSELLAIVAFLSVFFPGGLARYSRWLVIGGLSFLALFFVGLIKWQYIFYCQSKTITEKLVSQNGGAVYGQIKYYAPFFTLGQTTDGQWRNPLNYQLLNEFYNFKYPSVALPYELEGFKAEDSAECLAGDAGALRVGEYYVLPQNERMLAENNIYGPMYMWGSFRVTTESGNEHGVYASLLGFETAGGSIWYLFLPDRAYWLDSYKAISWE
ncbi:MAG: DUF6056 family protein [Muribaculum sp.]|nr:DUF6056 family protein [Muribaculaceae bacterium]MCM1081384.1 DUF6056 family protein [Muribaculum sp.]